MYFSYHRTFLKFNILNNYSFKKIFETMIATTMFIVGCLSCAKTPVTSEDKTSEMHFRI